MIAIVSLFVLLGLYVRFSKKFPTLSGKLIAQNRAILLGWFFIINSVVTYALSGLFYFRFFYSHYSWYEAYVSYWYLLTFIPSVIVALYFVLFGKTTDSNLTEPTVESNQKSVKRKFAVSFLVWWVCITLIYSFFILSSGSLGTMFGYIAGVFGLFTPIGPFSIMSMVIPIHLVSNVVSLFLIFIVAKWGNAQEEHMQLYGTKKILFILAALLLITIIADFIRGMPFASFYVLIDGGIKLRF